MRPYALPGGRGILFDARGGDRGVNMLHAFDSRRATRKALGIQGSSPVYLASGHLVYLYQDSAFAVPFDLDSLETRGDPVPLPEKIRHDLGALQLAVGNDGTLAYLPARTAVPRLVRVDRHGSPRPLVANPLPFQDPSDPRFSPDGKRLVLAAGGIWIVDLDTGIPTLVADEGFYPVWSPDGKTLAYAITGAESYDLYRRPTDLSEAPKLLLDKENNLRTAAWAPDGDLIYREEIPGKGMDLALLAEADFDHPADAARPLLDGPDDELAPALSRDGRWMAFVSGRSGRDEVYVTTFPKPSGLTQVSIDGGTSPAWSPDGSELFYIEADKMIAVKVTTKPAFRMTAREFLFGGSYLQYRWQRQYDIDPRTGEFVMVESPPGATDVEIVLDWFTELRKLAPRAE